MEYPEIGRRCATPDCQQLDFLPLTCKCGKDFCSDHFNTHVSLCEKGRQLSDSELRRIKEIYLCSHPDCKDRSVLPLICDKCKKHYCIKHRHIIECFEKDPVTKAAELDKYLKPVQEFNDAKALVDKQVDFKLEAAKKSSKNRETAIKIQLMKIKNKATGLKSIPTTDRIYFNILHTKNGVPEKTTPVFVSKVWSVGRSIDAVAEECKLQNNNNKAVEKKLRLFKSEDGEIISKNVADILQVLVNNKVILDGDNLILDYVDDNCTNIQLK